MPTRHAVKKTKAFKLPIETSFGAFVCRFEPSYPERGFTVTAPKAPGFVAYGETLPEAKRLAKSGLEFHCQCIVREQLFDSPTPGRHSVRRRIRVHV